MSNPSHTFKRALRSGTGAGLYMSAAIGLIGKMAIGKAVAPLNAISHILWGHKAARANNWSMKYTGSGLILNQLACLFWAGCYEALIDEKRRPGFSKAVAVSAVAYVTDYHVVPPRFTPGFEFVFPRRMFPYLYAALAISLVAGVRMRR
ncbi:MAG TPA: hypothetical protein VFG71_09170 [Nitrospiraceae bacterium]|nr:hypothetical protein [Nitrospiraceae bacterium]